MNINAAMKSRYIYTAAAMLLINLNAARKTQGLRVARLFCCCFFYAAVAQFGIYVQWHSAMKKHSCYFVNDIRLVDRSYRTAWCECVSVCDY